MHDSLAGVAFSMLVIFASAKLLSELCERLRQPGVVGEIIAGIVIGPYVLGWIQPNPVLTVLSELGVMFLLFRVGLEVKPSELISLGGRAGLIAISGVIVPFAAGWGLANAWSMPSTEAIFVGAALVATSVGITAQVLSAGGWLDTRAAKIILAAAVIDDDVATARPMSGPIAVSMKGDGASTVHSASSSRRRASVRPFAASSGTGLEPSAPAAET